MAYTQDLTLAGDYIILRSPGSDDLEGLCDAANDGEIWKNPYTIFPSVSEMSVYYRI